ncbi:MAG: hemerythrin domain-containing protein [Burkholderiaceae bacterium]
MNPVVNKLSPSATRMIRMDHAHVIAQFHKLDPDTSASVRGGVLRSICAALEIHAQLEEEIFYPALCDAGIQMPELDKSVPEHEEMRCLIARVRATGTDGEQQNGAIYDLMNAVMHHVADEETKLLPAAEKTLGKERLSELGAEMTARRLELAKPRAGELALELVKAAPGKTALATVGVLVAGTMLVNRMRRKRDHLV